MVPMTVSFFLKGSENVAAGRFKAAMYGLFIVLIYTVPIAILILVTRFVGGDAVTANIFNWLSTHWIPNILFFVIFMVFAASFFGAFEITLPQSLVNKSDQNSDKKGLAGVFFMALTLVLVSFSCTGPIVGNVLIQATSSGGSFITPIIVMLAFSTAFAIPFTVFAFSPTLLKKFKKSGGGWLNSVKVVIGFVEVALGLKFLSVADQTYHWGILDREVYLAIWIVVFALLGLYLLGKIRFAHDEPVEKLSVGRLSLAIGVFAFVVYLIPGMWGAPLKGLSGYLPPIQTHDFIVDNAGLKGEVEVIKDFEEALIKAEKENKPIFVDVTGHGCVNCREMEARVWSDPEVKALMNEYVVVALYVDDRESLPKSKWIKNVETGEYYKRVGQANDYIANTLYNTSTQPTYVLLQPNGNILMNEWRNYDLDIPAFASFLERGLKEHKKNN
jgi:thiol:disulfide interchange protein DsbD